MPERWQMRADVWGAVVWWRGAAGGGDKGSVRLSAFNEPLVPRGERAKQAGKRGVTRAVFRFRSPTKTSSLANGAHLLDIETREHCL